MQKNNNKVYPATDVVTIRVVVLQVSLVYPSPVGQLLVQEGVQVLCLLFLRLARGFPKENVHDLLEEHCVGVGVERVDQRLLPRVLAMKSKLFRQEDVDRHILSQHQFLTEGEREMVQRDII